MDGRHEEQESQYGTFPKASLGLERLSQVSYRILQQYFYTHDLDTP